MRPNELHPFLKAISLFGSLPEKSLTRLASIAEMKHFAPNSFLFQEGETPGHVYGISTGAVMLLGRASGKDSVVEFLGPGDSLLLPSVLTQNAYVASARTTTPVSAIVLPAGRFVDMAREDASLSMQCALSVARQWSVLLGQVTEIKSHGAAQRVAHFLLAQVSATHGPAVLTLPAMKKQVATRLGIKPETFSRTLRKLREVGVEANGDLIRIRSVEKLAALLDTAADS